ncbi:MAG TPA: hypothetical protein EYG57_05635 [Planctomycetes bacterium]|nr:hypothetical protein [Planctomycetota bacterium]
MLLFALLAERLANRSTIERQGKCQHGQESRGNRAGKYFRRVLFGFETSAKSTWTINTAATETVVLLVRLDDACLNNFELLRFLIR